VIRFLAGQVKAEHRVLTLDFAGTGGTFENLAACPYTIRDANLRAVGTSAAVISGVGSTGVAIALLTPSSVFADYDGSKDGLGVVVTPAASMTFGTNGTGPRLLRYKSDYSQSNDLFGFSSADGSDRMVGANITSAAAGTYISSGASFDPRAFGGVFTRGVTTAGWTDTAPTQGEQLSPVQAESRRATSTAATQTDGGLLAMGTGDVVAIGLGSIVGALTGAMSQDATGLTFTLGSTTMKVRYVYLHHMKGS